MTTPLVSSTATAQNLSRTAEKLIILLDYSLGLLTRVHGCVHFQRGTVFSELNEKILDHLSQKKDDPTANIGKIVGSDVISMKAEALENETKFAYETIADILAFSHEVLPLFETLTRNILNFDVKLMIHPNNNFFLLLLKKKGVLQLLYILFLDLNSDLTTRFLGVFFNFIKIYLLAARITDAKLGCYLYTLAYKEHHRKEHDDAHLLSLQFIKKVKQFLTANMTPLRQLQKEFSTVPRAADVVSDAIQCVMQSFYTWTNYESLKVGQYFSVSQQNPETFAQPVEDDKID
ncbi:hypothetical protein RFI_14246, partial [Reticulomyxa filosa]